MEFRNIRHFIHVAEVGSLSTAAEHLHMVQPALSQSIKKLEENLSVTLFTRSKRGMELTESGRIFLKHAYGILNQYNRAKENLLAANDDPIGLVSVGMTASVLNVLSVPLCRSIKNKYPRIQLNLEEGLEGNIQYGFEAGWYDIVVSCKKKHNETMVVEKLLTEELFLVSPYDASKNGKKEEIKFKDIVNYPLIIPQDHHSVTHSIEEIANSIDVEIISTQFSGALHPTLQLIEAGFGSSILPWSAIFEQVQKKRLTAQKVVKPSIKRTVSMSYPSHRPLTQASLAVMEMLRCSVIEAHRNDKWPGQLFVKASN